MAIAMIVFARHQTRLKPETPQTPGPSRGLNSWADRLNIRRVRSPNASAWPTNGKIQQFGTGNTARDQAGVVY